MPRNQKQGRGRGRSRLEEERSQPSIAVGASAATACQQLHADASVATAAFDKALIKKTDSKIETTTLQEKNESQQVILKKLGLNLDDIHFDLPFPRRPDTGKLGKMIRLISNWFLVKAPDGFIYHYDVDIGKIEKSEEKNSDTSESLLNCIKRNIKMSAKRNREVYKTMLSACNHFLGHHPAYDGQKNLYTRKPLEGAPFAVKVVLNNEETQQCVQVENISSKQEEFIVTVKPVQKKETDNCAINLSALHDLFEGKVHAIPQEIVTALEAVFRHNPSFNFVPVGRSFYHPPDEPKPLKLGREVWTGHHQSLYLGQKAPMLNIDISAKIFYQNMSVINFVCEILEKNEEGLKILPFLNDGDHQKIENELKNLQIQVTHLPYNRKKPFRIVKVTKEPAKSLKFSLTVNGESESKTIAEYFREKYRINLNFPQLPCIQVAASKEICFPLEVCKLVEGQYCAKELSDDQKREVAKYTSKSPDKRFIEIGKIVENARFNQDECVKEFDLTVDLRPVKVSGRVIESPNIIYSDGEKARPQQGQWDMKNKSFYIGTDINKWILVSFAPFKFCPKNRLTNFIQKLQEIGDECGISINEPAMIDTIVGRNPDVKAILESAQRNYNARFAVVILHKIKNVKPEDNMYFKVKEAAETTLGLVTQCVQDRNVVECNRPLLLTICQKINTKMGGINNCLRPGEIPVMFKKSIIIGADVSHSSPTEKSKQSFAAAVGSLDEHASRYTVTCREQTNPNDEKKIIELILDFKSMVIDLLKAYENENERNPESIIIYRDGVSDGWFSYVRGYEMKQVREACLLIDPHYTPKITFIIVKKNHPTRFRPEDMREGVGRQRNIPPGTTVDTVISHPVKFDFYLCSQYGLLGTSRPGHYTVVENENSFTADEIQNMTYCLCHRFARCTKSISAPAPIRYAHLAAARAHQHALAKRNSFSPGGSSSVSSNHFTVNNNAVQVTSSLKSSMYFV